MGGSSGGGSRSPQIAPNTLNSAQKLKVIDLISSGEIAGFINGNDNPLKSVYLNDTPVQNDDNSMNHAGVQFEFNRGSLDQDYFPSSTSVDNSVSVGVEVEKKTPITRTVTNQQVTSVRVTVGVDALLFTTQTGDQWPAGVAMSIQILKDGNIFTSQTMSMWEKGNKPFHQDYVFSNLPAAPFDIRCVRITEDSTDDMLKNKTYFFSYVESVDSKLRIPGTAAALLQIDSQQFGSNNPSRNYGIKGCIVQVPSNYDPVNRTYTGLWDRLFKPAYTNNPAWVLYDVLTADECLGEKFEDYRIDIDRLYELSKHCDVLVDDGNGGKEPRFVCNMVMFGGDASTVLDNICSIFRGTYSSANNHFTVQFDQKSDPVAVYNNSSVENGEFNYSYVPVTELFNQIKVEYIDKDDGYRTKIDEVSDESNIAKYGLRSTSITAFGATKRSYALRCAKWNLVTALTENETVTFVVGAAGIRHEQHDIIKIADNDYAGAQIGGRIESVNGNTITVDRELKNVKSFTININGSVEEFKVVKTINTKTYQLDSVVNAVDYVQFVATLNNLEPRLFRCIHIEEDSEVNKYTITAIKHNPQKEAIVDKGAEYIEGNHSVLNTLPHLSNGIVTTEGRAIVLRWDSLETVGSENTYVVKLYNGLDFVSRDETKETFIKYENLKSGNYTARIRAVNENGQFSEELVITFSTTYEINGLRATPIVFGIKLNWEVPEIITTDAHTEIWYAKENDREVATKLSQLPYPQNTYTLNGLSAGEELYFWFRLVDIDGNQGEFTRALTGRASQDADDILGYLDGKITDDQISQELKDQFEKDINDAVDSVNTSIKYMNAEDMLANIALRTENETRFSQDSILSASTANNSASISQLETVVTDEFRAIAQREVAINSKIDNNTASINSVSQSVVDNEKAQSIVNSENNAKFNENEAKTGLSSIALATENTARAQNDSVISANVANNNAEIHRIDTVVVDNEKSTAQAIEFLNSKVGENSASISEIKTTTATIDGKVSALYTMKVDANGNIAGMMIGADEYSSQVKFLADTFVVATPDQEINMFAVQNIDGKQIAHFNVDDLIAKGSISGDRFIAGSSIEAPIINGGKVNSVEFNGGFLNIGDGNCTIQNNGDFYAKNGTFEGTVYAEKIEGDVTKVRSIFINSYGYAKLIIEPENFDRVIVFSDLSTSLALNSTLKSQNSTRMFKNRVIVKVNNSNRVDREIRGIKYMSDISLDYIMTPSNIVNFQHEIKKGETAVIELQGFTLTGGSNWANRDIFQGSFHALIFKGNL